MKIRYKIISYDGYEKPKLKEKGEKELPDDMFFDDAINLIVKEYDESFVSRQIYVDKLCEMTWNKYFEPDFVFHMMNLDSYHYKWLHESLHKVEKSFKLFENELRIIIDGPGIGGQVARFEGVKIIIRTGESGEHKDYPHVHAEYSGQDLFIYIHNGSILDNESFKSPRKTKLAVEYVRENKEFLLEKWKEITQNDVCIDAVINIEEIK